MTTLTREQLLKDAEVMMRQKGYSAFSYADLAKRIGITKAGIHYHFPSKDRLGEEVVKQAYSDTEVRLSDIIASYSSAAQRIDVYASLFEESFRAGLLPLCCALSAEVANLPEQITGQTTRYFEMQLAWLSRVIEEGIRSGEVISGTAPDESALAVINLCEGASVVARATRKPEVFAANRKHIFKLLGATLPGEHEHAELE